MQQGTRIFVLVMTVFSAAAIVTLSFIDKPDKSASEERALEVDTALVSQLTQTIELMERARVITKVEFSGFPARVYVGEPFYLMSFEQKTAAMKTISDFVAEKTGHHGGGMKFDVHDAMSGDRIYRWNYYKLER